MKKATILLLAMALTGCSSIHKVTPEKFQTDLQVVNSFYWYEYIGQADGKAYVLRKRPPLIGKEMKQDIIFTEVRALNPAFLRQLEESKKPK